MLAAVILLPVDARAGQRLLSPGDVDALTSKPADVRLPYGPGPAQFGDLRLPKGNGPFPLAIVIHGGCFVSKIATLQNSAAMADALRDAGLATWNIEYRGIDVAGGGWPGTYLDVGAASDHVRVLSDKYPIDRSRVISVGHSAGAVLALWLAGRGRMATDSPLYVRDPIRLAGAVALGTDGDLPPIGPTLMRLCGSNAADVFFESPANASRLAQPTPHTCFRAEHRNFSSAALSIRSNHRSRKRPT